MKQQEFEKLNTIAYEYLAQFEQQLSKAAAKTYFKIHINNLCNVDNIQKYNNELTLSQSMIVGGFVREIIENY